MERRFGVRILGAAAVAACALLVACGGGGGGGSSIPSGGGTPTPVTSTTPSPTPAASLVPGTDPTLPPHSASTSGWGPQDVANAFQFPVQSGYNGKGQTIAIFGDMSPAQADITQYLTYFNAAGAATGSFTVVPVTGGSTTGDPGGLDEGTLDVETVAGLAPGANIRYYSVPTTLSDQDFINAYNAVLQDATQYNIHVFNISYGGCEAYQGVDYTNPDHSVLAQLAAAGIAVVASSGDQGNECGNPVAATPANVPGVNYPASDPNVIGVGGTQTTTSIASTLAWNDAVNANAGGASGGGVSVVFTPPPSQIGVAGFASQSMRNVPDIAFPAVGVALFVGGTGRQLKDGTSWSAPQAAALLAEIDEYCGGSISPSFASPQSLFYLAYARSPQAFVDDIGNNNNYLNNTAPSYTAKAGPDNVTGLGEPLGARVAATLCPNRTPQIVARSMALPISAAYGPSHDFVLNNVPRLPGLSDLGERAAAAPTRVVLVMRATPTMASDLQSVAAKLREAGFDVTSASGMVIDATAPAATLASYFRTSLHEYAQPGAGTRYANAAKMTLPAAIAPYVQSVVADNLRIARPMLERAHP